MDIKTAIYHYCNYQDRCHKEVRNKLYELGGHRQQIEELIAELISADLLNEERYARAYARGKFRMLQWGKQKIIYQLRQHQISEYCIKKAMQEIDEDDYEATAQKLCEDKWMELRSERNVLSKKAKVYRYLMQKGYERQTIETAINNQLKK